MVTMTGVVRDLILVHRDYKPPYYYERPGYYYPKKKVRRARVVVWADVRGESIPDGECEAWVASLRCKGRCAAFSTVEEHLESTKKRYFHLIGKEVTIREAAPDFFVIEQERRSKPRNRCVDKGGQTERRRKS